MTARKSGIGNGEEFIRPFDRCAKCGHPRRDHVGLFKSCAWRGNYGRWLCFTTAQACFCGKFREPKR